MSGGTRAVVSSGGERTWMPEGAVVVNTGGQCTRIGCTSHPHSFTRESELYSQSNRDAQRRPPSNDTDAGTSDYMEVHSVHLPEYLVVCGPRTLHFL